MEQLNKAKVDELIAGYDMKQGISVSVAEEGFGQVLVQFQLIGLIELTQLVGKSNNRVACSPPTSASRCLSSWLFFSHSISATQFYLRNFACLISAIQGLLTFGFCRVKNPLRTVKGTCRR